MTLSKRKSHSNNQNRDGKGNFTNKNKQAHYNQDDGYVPEEYSSDSSETADEFIGACCNIVSNIKLEWNDDAVKNVKKAYVGNSTATHYRKYGPSGSFTNASKSTNVLGCCKVLHS